MSDTAPTYHLNAAAQLAMARAEIDDLRAQLDEAWSLIRTMRADQDRELQKQSDAIRAEYERRGAA